MPKLQISLPDGSQPSHDLIEDKITIGRVADNMIQIDDASVSSHHAELVRDGDGYILKDLDSTNGTTLNGQSHSTGALKDGDAICFGNINVAYVSEDPAAAQPMPAEEAVALQPASTSVRPSNFSNASPFQTKTNKKSTAAIIIYSLAALAMIAFGAAVFGVFGLKSPL